MTEERRESRLVVLLTPSERDLINEFRWARKIKTEAQATRQLIEMGLAYAEEPRRAR